MPRLHRRLLPALHRHQQHNRCQHRARRHHEAEAALPLRQADAGEAGMRRGLQGRGRVMVEADLGEE